MRVAQVPYDQARTLDPVIIPADAAIAVPIGGVCGIIGLIPSGWGPALLCGELRGDDDQPMHMPGDRPSRPGRMLDAIIAPATVRGMGLLLAGLERQARHRPVRAVRRAS